MLARSSATIAWRGGSVVSDSCVTTTRPLRSQGTSPHDSARLPAQDEPPQEDEWPCHELLPHPAMFFLMSLPRPLLPGSDRPGPAQVSAFKFACLLVFKLC